ncbi:MAG: YdcF family protein [Gemmatimonadales bacterium]
MSRLTRRVTRFALLAILVAALAYGVSFLAVWTASRQDQRRRTDAIVVLGAAQYNGRPSPVLRARLDHAYQLYRAGFARKVVVTGGTGPGDTESEAMVSRRYLISRGVPAQSVVVRPEGRSTFASMQAVGEWARENEVETVLLVSDPFHMGRLLLEARRVQLEAYSSPTKTSPISENPRREAGFLAAEALKLPVAWVRSW